MTGRAAVEVFPERYAESNLPKWAAGDPTGNLRFRFRAANNEADLASTQGYPDESHVTEAVESAIDTVCKVAGIETPDPIEFVLRHVDH